MKLNHSTMIWLGGMLGILLTIAVTVSVFQYQNQTEINQFQAQTQRAQQQLSNQLDKAKDNLNYIATSFYINPQNNQTQLIDKYSDLYVYAPIVPHPNRQSFEKQKQEDGYITFHINNGQHASDIHAAYLPITHIEPFNVDHAKLLGLDLLNKKSARQAILLATRTGKLALSMIQLHSMQKEPWIFKAVYSGLAGNADPYFAKHQMEMLNAIVGLHLPFSMLLKEIDLPANIHTKLTLLNNTEPKAFAWQLSLAGLQLSQAFNFRIDSKSQLQLYIHKIVPWSYHHYWLLLLVALIGIVITIMLIRANLAIIRNQQYKNNILQSSFEGILSFDAQGFITDMNPASTTIFKSLNINVKEPIYQLFEFSHIHPDSPVNFGQQLIRHKENLLNQPIELKVHTPKQIKGFIECSITSLKTGSPIHFTMFLREISKRKKNEEELAQLATIVEQSFNAIIVTDRHGIINYVNPAFEKISGFSSTEVLGKNPNIIKSSQHPDQYYQDMWKTLESGQSWTGNFINKAKDGNFYEVEQTIFPIYAPSNHQHIGYTSIQQDVTERKRIQKQDEHTQRLESLGVLAGGIAHDFNNLLTAIMGNASLAQNNAQEPLRYQQYLNNIIHASENAANLCTQMLAYSGKGQFIIRSINLSEMIEKIMQLLHSSVHKQVSLNMNLDEKLPYIEGDAGQMQQIIMNLIINASEAIGQHNGQIHVSTSSIDLTTDDLLELLNGENMQAGKYINLQVEDDGCGMDLEVQAKIFDPFFTTKFTGRGLGMSAILGIIRGHHGGLQMQSEVQKGTSFNIYFPVCDQAEINSQQTPQDHIGTTSGTVLIVDDEVDIRELAHCILEDIGIMSYLAVDGEHGLDLLQQHLDDIDLILLDMTMPKLGGHAFYQQIQGFAPDMPVIIASGYSEIDIRERFSQELQGSDLEKIYFLQKPYMPDLLSQTVQTVLRKHKT